MRRPIVLRIANSVISFECCRVASLDCCSFLIECHFLIFPKLKNQTERRKNKIIQMWRIEFCHKIEKTKAAIKLLGFDSNQQSKNNRLHCDTQYIHFTLHARVYVLCVRSIIFFSFILFFSPKCDCKLLVCQLCLEFFLCRVFFPVSPCVQFRIGSFIFGMIFMQMKQSWRCKAFSHFNSFTKFFFRLFFSSAVE